MKHLFLCGLLFFSGCSTVKVTTIKKIVEAPYIQNAPLIDQLTSIPEIDGAIITVAVYGFEDRTGQRKTIDNVATFSSAVTQGAESWLIESLQLAGNGSWFQVLERSSLDNLVKERYMYRQAQEEFNQTQISELRPLLFAGILAEGGIIAYDTNKMTGGYGARIMGIGASSLYRKDVITVSLRFISTSTGEVLLSVATTKTIFSATVSGNAIVFFSNGVKYGEIEAGASGNEPVNLALRAAIDAAVIEIIRRGEQRGYWKYKNSPTTNHNNHTLS
jgi:curli production assembly/transport component CsgG